MEERAVADDARAAGGIPVISVAPTRAALGAGAALLAAVTLFVFLPLRHAGFLNYDDPEYVSGNPHVRGGFTPENVVWALTNADFNWHPLTRFSHMLDYRLFGLDAGAHHLESVLVHLANTLLLLWVLGRCTGAWWRSFFVAGLFALHPLHVEPVAWISARKDLLSTFFWFAALLAYVRWAERPALARYLVLCLCMVLSLTSKGMIVTLPLMLLLLDYWPLRRWPGSDRARIAALVLEKTPLFAIAAVGMLVQFAAQHSVGAVQSLQGVPVSLRLGNAVISYASYLVKMVWPADLALPYLLPESVPIARFLAASAGLGAVSACVARFGRDRPYLVTGWLWYLATLLPVIGIVQIGQQSMADRYTYVSLVGVFVALTWLGADLAAAFPRVGAWRAAVALAVLGVCAVLSRAQVRHWQDSISLFRHTIAVTGENPIAENNLGTALEKSGRREEARIHYERALRFDPNHVRAHNNLGALLRDDGRFAEAEQHFLAALRLRPYFAEAVVGLGFLRLRQGDPRGAKEVFLRAIEMDANDARAHFGLGQALSQGGEAGAHAREAFAESLRLYPDNSEARNNLGALLAAEGRLAEAEEQFREAVRLRPDYAGARMNLGLARLHAGDHAGARAQFAAVASAEPENGLAHLGLARALEGEGRAAEAAGSYRRALELLPDAADARAALERLGAAQ